MNVHFRIENSVLQNETQMFEKYLKRNEPKDSGGGLGGLGGGLTVSSSNQDIMRGMNRKRSKSRGANLDKSLRLTTEQKCDIAQKELDELKEEIEKYRDNCERIVDNFKVIVHQFTISLFYIDAHEILRFPSEKNTLISQYQHCHK